MTDLIDSEIDILTINDGQENIIPVGAISFLSSSSIPSGWLVCNGQAISRQTYNRLFLLIGTSFGSGDGSTTFNLPDLQERSPLGNGDYNIGSIGGQNPHNHEYNHSHGVSNHTHNVNHRHTATHTHDINHIHGSSHNHAIGTHTHSYSHYHSGSTSSGPNSKISQSSALGSRAIANHTHSVSWASSSPSVSASSNTSDLPNTATTNVSATFDPNLALLTGYADASLSNEAVESSQNNIISSDADVSYLAIKCIIKW